MTAHDVAKYIISVSREHGEPISNLKLQKLLYYAQAWHLALYDGALFDERLEAWVHGPAVPPVYGEYKQWSWQPICADVPEIHIADERIKAHLDEVLDVYGGLTAMYLEKLTHQEDPWLKARGDLPPDVPSHNIISHDDMRNYYRARLRGQDQANQ